MTEDKKYVLRWLVEYGLSLTAICCESDTFKIYSPTSWLKHYQLVKATASFARWLQKLAFFSSINFEGFDENIFWEEYKFLIKSHPGNGFIMVRQFYSQRLQQVLGSKAL